MTLPKGLNYDNQRNVYRIKLHYKGIKLYDRTFKNKNAALKHYPIALEQKKQFIKQYKPKDNVKIKQMGLAGIINTLLYAI